jgi:two-component system, OmpR family, response regulator
VYYRALPEPIETEAEMATKAPVAIFNEDVYVVAVKGEDQLRGAETSLTPSELEVLVHIDGKSTIAEIMERIRSLPPQIVMESLESLHWHNLIKVAEEANALDFVEFFSSKTPDSPSPGAVAAAEPEVSDGTSILKQDGYFVRIARRVADGRKPARDQKSSIVVIEDEPHLVKFLRQFLVLEGFDVRIATNKSEIIKELSSAPRPDLVLLDVMLPDADGFDILLRIRQHPALNTVPVIMLTAKATRDAVLKGLSGGADGYVTKPFEMEILIKAVKTVLGFSTQ